jgi:Fe-S cluster assembly protein SufD
MSRTTIQPAYLTALLAGECARETSFALAWLSALRGEAVDRVGALTVPTTREEDWRFTDMSAVGKLAYQPVRSTPQIAATEIAECMLPDMAARLVFVDGCYAPQLSFNRSAMVVENLASAAVNRRAEIEPHLARLAGIHDRVFAALNTAYLHDGAVVIVPRSAPAPQAVHVIHLATRPSTASYPRCLLIAEAGSAVTLVEEFRARTNEAYLVDAVTEISVAADASVHHVRVQGDSHAAFHIAACAAVLARGSRYHSVSIAHGAALSRCDLDVRVSAPGAECSIDGLAIVGGSRLADTHSSIDHQQPDGVSRQLHKCIVDASARAVFNGKIMVRPGAQHTDSAQSSRNLLMSPSARVDTKPQLEIFADDVKCAHGATVGQLDAEEVFYLQSRGLSEAAARDLLTYAFGAEIVQRIPVAALRKRLERLLLERHRLKS